MQHLATIDLKHCNSNAFEILGICQNAAREAGASKAEIGSFLAEAIQGDHDHLLHVVTKHFNVAMSE